MEIMFRTAIASAFVLAVSSFVFGASAIADEPPYEMMKDQVLSSKMEAYINASMQNCPKGTEEDLVACVHARTVRAWPQGELAASHCASRSDAFEELDCITMTALGIDLAILSGESDIAAFLDKLGSDNGDATSDAAIRLAKAIWNACPDSPKARKCRLGETLHRLELSETEAARCDPLKDDRKMVSCLMLGRVRNQVEAATARIAQLAP